MEDGSVSYPDAGSPQGGVISPLLSNVFLHYVLDLWFEQEVKPRLRGRAFLIRYADDFVIGFRDERDAQRVMEVLPKRFGKYGLTVHPDKTRLVPLPSAVAHDGEDDRNEPRRSSWDVRPAGLHPLLGSIPARLLGRQTQDGLDRFSRAVRSIDSWCRDQPAPAAQRAATEAEREATRTLRVLRCHGQLGGRCRGSSAKSSALAEVAQPPQPPPRR